MSIVEAVERAKKLSKARTAAAAAAKYEDEGEVATLEADPVGEVMAREQAQVERHAPAIEPVTFTRLHYDAAVCAENHIIVPGADATVANAASPSYRMLRARILQCCRSNHWCTIAITSPGPGEGKSVTALNLSIALARQGNYDVFLLDLDMRNPSLCRYLGVRPRAQMVDFFAGRAEPHEVLFTAGIDKLTLAGSIDNSPNASELLSGHRLEQLLAFIRRSAPTPLILIDLPPVVSTDDALVVVPRVDATMMVVSEGRTRRDELERATELLADFPMAGFVLNRSLQSMGSDYYGNYSNSGP